jgi:hypothetical protein
MKVVIQSLKNFKFSNKRNGKVQSATNKLGFKDRKPTCMKIPSI